jgi:hypothetical protein
MGVPAQSVMTLVQDDGGGVLRAFHGINAAPLVWRAGMCINAQGAP